MVSLSYDDAKRLVEAEIAKEGAGYVYSRADVDSSACVNVERNEDGELVGSCLVGRALLAAGVDIAELEEYSDSEVYNLKEAGIVSLTEKALNFLQVVQARQDVGDTWGSSLEAATRYVASRDSELYEPYDDMQYS